MGHFAVKFLLVVYNQLCVDFSRDEFLLQHLSLRGI